MFRFARSLQNFIKPPPRVVWLHVGKTAGTALNAMVREHNSRCGRTDMKVLPHSYSISAACRDFPTSKLGFFIRDPIDRFVSGFLTRQRQGRPRYDSPWTEGETRAFTRFRSPEELCQGIARGDPEAIEATRAIFHLRLDLTHYLESADALHRYKERIVWIGRTECFDADLPLMRSCLALDSDLEPPRDDVGAHRNPPTANRTLSVHAREVLRRWLVSDFAVYEAALLLYREGIERAKGA